MADVKEEMINRICELISKDKNIEDMQNIKNQLVIILAPYKITIETQALSTEVKSEDLKAYQMFFISKKIEGLSDKTLKNYKYIVDELLKFINKDLNDITTNDVRYFLAVTQEQSGCSNSYNDTRRRYLNSFFSWLETEGYIERSPLKAIKKIKYEKRVRLPFEPDEIEKLRDAIKHLDEVSNLSDEYKIELYRKRNIAILEVLLSTGMRVGEMALLRMQDLNLIEGTVKVLGKGSKERICYLNEVAKMRLEEYIKFRNIDTPFVFTHIFNQKNKNSKPLSISGIEIIVREAGKIAGIDNVHPHRFRRTAATWCIRRGMPIEQVRQMLGHENIETTLIYAITNNDDLQTSHKKYMN